MRAAPPPRRHPPRAAAVRLYARLIRLSLAVQRQYAADFALGFGVAALTAASEIVIFAVILSDFHAIGGWGVWEIALLYGVTMGSYALHRIGAGDLHSLSDYVRDGEFDQLLLRPWSPLLALILRSGRIGQLANLTVPIATLAVAVARLLAAGVLRPAWPWALPLVFAAATALQYALGIAANAAAFWIVRADEVTVLAINAPNTASEYPLAVYPAWLRGYLLTLVPVGLCVYLPLRALVGRGGGWPSVALAPAAAALALAAALAVWRAGERRYQSTGT